MLKAFGKLKDKDKKSKMSQKQALILVEIDTACISYIFYIGKKIC